MTDVLKKALQLLTGIDQPTALLKMPKARPLIGLTERELIKLESKIGSKLFGPIPADHRREFFCLDEHTWVWHEEWIDTESGVRKSLTTRYEVHENGILKAQEGSNYSFIEGEELKNLALAIQLYYEQVARHIYKRDPKTRQKIA